MRLFLILGFCLISVLALAEDFVYVSSLANGAQPGLSVAKFGRTSTNGPLNFLTAIALNLSKPGGVTSLQPNGTTQLHVYRTELVGNKARIVRETVDLATFRFVSGSTKAFPANLSSSTMTNFDSNDVLALVQRQTGTRLYTRPLNPAGNLVGGFRALPSFPFRPFGAHISDGKPFFFSGLWIDPNSHRTGVMFANVNAPASPRSFLFRGSVLAHDISLSFPRQTVSSRAGTNERHFIYFFVELLNAIFTPSSEAKAVPTVRVAAITLERATFSPGQNVIQIAAPRSIVNVSNASPFQFHGIGTDPLGIAVAYLRWNLACGSNEIIVQTFDPVRLKKVGPPKFARQCSNGLFYYGLSVFNPKFTNGSND